MSRRAWSEIKESSTIPGWLHQVMELGIWLMLLGLVTAGFRSVFGFGLLQEARALLLDNPYLVDGSRAWQNLSNDLLYAPGWTPGNQWRPLVRLSWMAEVRFFGSSPLGYHLVSLAWHLIGVSGIYLLARRALRLPLTMALAAGVLFGLHPLAAQPTCVVMARADVAVAASVIWAVAAIWIWSRGGSAWWMVLHLVAVVLALGNKEAGLVAAPVCTVVVLMSRKSWGEKIRAVLPAWALAALFLSLRLLALGKEGGELAMASPGHWLAGWALYQLNLLNIVMESPTRDMPYVEARSTARVTWFMAVLLFNVGLFGLFLVRREWPGIKLMAWTTLAAAPVLLAPALVAHGKAGHVIVTDGWVYFALPGAALLIPMIVHRIDRRPLTLAFLGACLTWSFICASVLAPLIHAAFTDDLSHLGWLDRRQDRTPAAHQSNEDRCAHLERQIPRQVAMGESGRVLELERKALRKCGKNLNRTLQVAASLITAGRHDQAAPLLKALIEPPDGVGLDHARSHELAGVVALEQGNPKRAMELLDRAVFLGVRGCSVHRRRLRTSRLVDQPAQGALAAEALHECKGRVDPDPLLDAMELWLKAGNLRRANHLVPHIKTHYPISPPNKERFKVLNDRLDRAVKRAEKRKNRKKRRKRKRRRRR